MAGTSNMMKLTGVRSAHVAGLDKRPEGLDTSAEVVRRDMSHVPDEEGHRLARLEEGQGVVHDNRPPVDNRERVVLDQDTLGQRSVLGLSRGPAEASGAAGVWLASPAAEHNPATSLHR